MKKLLIMVAGLLVAAALGANTAPSDIVGPTAASGTINTVPGSQLADGETFTIGDGAGVTETFEFDSNGSVTPGHQGVAFSAADSAFQTMGDVKNAVNASPLRIDASPGGYAAVSLLNQDVGSAGNVPITETVTAQYFTVSGMSGGVNAPTAATLVRFSADSTRQGVELDWRTA